MLRFFARIKSFFVYHHRCTKLLRAAPSYESIPYPKHRAPFFLLKTLGDKNKDKVFYLIETPNGNNYGFFALFRYVVSSMYVCLRTGFIPHVITKGTRYDRFPGDNMFENYFEQPFNTKTEDVLQSFNVIEHNEKHIDLIEQMNHNSSDLTNGYVISDDYLRLMANIIKRYVRLKPEVKEKLEQQINGLIKQPKKTIAIHFRGNAFNIGLKDHPAPLTIEDYYPFVDECFSKGYEKIFLATDEQQTAEKLCVKYPNKVVFFDDTFRSSNGFDLHEQVVDREDNNYLLGYEALRDMLALSWCGALICGLSQLSIISRIYKLSRDEEYEYLHIINKRFNAKTNKKRVKEYIKNRRKM